MAYNNFNNIPYNITSVCNKFIDYDVYNDLVTTFNKDYYQMSLHLHVLKM